MKNKIDKLDFSTVLASSIHDMKNSLAMLLGSLAEISTDCQGGRCSKQLSQIRHEGERVNRDLIQLLTLYKIDKERYYLNIEEIDVCEFLQEMTEEYAYLFADHGIEVRLECDDDLSGFFDAELVYGVLTTIINNAYQYAKNKILINATVDNGYLKISILDNGNGYPEHMLHDPIAGGSSTSFGTGSTGLGLYFSAQVAALHRNKKRCGYIEIRNTAPDESAAGGGCFSLFLP